ncbi:hypothetical protein CCAX7_61760 [Capsulimonas corticalis]|uniref:Uncharacterized protein n=1 Tax=Capsulimonas corticalis TaxID=2219043 RepID=A0A402CWE3_9BACT|nr:hypothetical protein [Capsulimonas corticalis]BDI34125.1 hypothetical protein CCAX7_61760 [Capsulimonas corticalis]
MHSTEETRAPSLIRPLARHREPHVAEQLKSIEHLDAGRLLALVQGPRSHEMLSDEALVTVIRFFIAVGDDYRAGRAMNALFVRLRPWIRKYVGATDNILEVELPAEEVWRDIFQLVAASVCDLSAEQEFWECRFGVCLIRKATQIVRRYRQRLRTEEAALTVDKDGEEVDAFDGMPSLALSPVQEVLVRDALSRLPRHPKPIYQTFWLVHYVSLPVSSADPEEPTVMKHLDLKRKTVYNYLATAESILSAWRKEKQDAAV